MTNPTEQAYDTVCVCGHERIDHEGGYKCQEVSLIRNGAKALCGCDLFRPATVCPECNSEILPTQYCMMGHWCGEPVVPTVTAHDTPAAKLRERLAEALHENERLRSEIDDSKLCQEGFWFCAPAERLVSERDSARAEAADLWARLADEDARWNTLADGYAGAMRELAEVKLIEVELRKAIQWACNEAKGRLPKWFQDLALYRAAQRPEAEGREG